MNINALLCSFLLLAPIVKIRAADDCPTKQVEWLWGTYDGTILRKDITVSTSVTNDTAGFAVIMANNIVSMDGSFVGVDPYVEVGNAIMAGDIGYCYSQYTLYLYYYTGGGYTINETDPGYGFTATSGTNITVTVSQDGDSITHQFLQQPVENKDYKLVVNTVKATPDHISYESTQVEWTDGLQSRGTHTASTTVDLHPCYYRLHVVASSGQNNYVEWDEVPTDESPKTPYANSINYSTNVPSTNVLYGAAELTAAQASSQGFNLENNGTFGADGQGNTSIFDSQGNIHHIAIPGQGNYLAGSVIGNGNTMGAGYAAGSATRPERNSVALNLMGNGRVQHSAWRSATFMKQEVIPLGAGTSTTRDVPKRIIVGPRNNDCMGCGFGGSVSSGKGLHIPLGTSAVGGSAGSFEIHPFMFGAAYGSPSDNGVDDNCYLNPNNRFSDRFGLVRTDLIAPRARTNSVGTIVRRVSSPACTATISTTTNSHTSITVVCNGSPAVAGSWNLVEGNGTLTVNQYVPLQKTTIYSFTNNTQVFADSDVTVTTTITPNADGMTEVVTKKNAANQVASVTTFDNCAIATKGFLPLTITEDPNGAALVTTVTYDNGLPSLIVGPYGKWTRYTYSGETLLQMDTGKDNADTNSPNTAWISMIYTNALLPGDQGTMVMNSSPRSTTIKVGNVPVYQEYKIFYTNRIKTIQCPNPADGYNSVSNLITTVYPCTEGAAWTLGEPRKIEYPDGTRSVFTYDFPYDNVIVVTEMRGAPNTTNSLGVISGTRNITVKRPGGTVLSTSIYDIDTETLISQTVNANLDSNDRPQSVYGLSGLTNTITYGCCGPESITYGNGVSRVLSYDGEKRLYTDTTSRGSESTTLTYTYNADAHLIGVQHSEAGGAYPLSYTEYGAQYDYANRLRCEVNADGQTNWLTYTSPSGQLVITKTYPNGATIITNFYKDDTIQSIVGTGATPTAFEAGVESLSGVSRYYSKVYAADSTGSPTSYWKKAHYDGAARPIQLSASLGSRATYQYNSKGQLAAIAPTNFAGLLLSYSAKGDRDFLVQDTYGDGQMHLSGTNHVTYITNSVETGWRVERKYVWSTLNNSAGTLVTEDRTTPDTRNAVHKRYNNGNPITSATGWRYDSSQKTFFVTNSLPDNTRQVDVISLGLLATRTIYSTNGQQLNQKTFVYDHGRLKTATDSLTGTTTYNYSGNGRLQSVVTPAPQQTTSYAYNSIGKIATISLPDSSVITNEYALNGQIAKVSGSQQYPTAFAYDLYGRLSFMTNWGMAGPEVTQYIYDPTNGLLARMQYPDVKGVTNTINLSSRTLTTKDGNGVTRTITCNIDGTIAQISYATNGDANPMVLNYRYDRRGRLTSIAQTSQGNDSWVNDDIGNSTTETNSLGLVTTRFVNLLGLVTNTSVSLNGTTLSQIASTYTSAMRLQGLTEGSMASFEDFADTSLTKGLDVTQNVALRAHQTTVLDVLGRISSLATLGNGVTVDSHGYSFTGLNQRSRDTRADGSRWDYLYDGMGQLTNATAYNPSGTVSLDGQANYAYDAIGNPISRRDTTISGLYGSVAALSDSFTVNNQLTGKSLTAALLISGSAVPSALVTLSNAPALRNSDEYQFSQSVNYAVNSNKTLTYQIVGVLSSANSEVATTNYTSVFVPSSAASTFSYDNNGNLLGDDRWTYTWDKRNQLASMVSRADSSNRFYQVTFTYDGFGRRKTRVTSTSSNGTWTTNDNRAFVYNGWDLVAELNGVTLAPLRTYAWGRQHRLLWVNDATYGTYIPAFDGNGNVTRLLSATNSAVLASYEYGPFGNVRRMSGALALVNPIRFSGQYQDPSGLIYYGYRYYAPALGRWINRDPIGVTGGVNLYGFVGNNPISRVDPYGLTWALFSSDAWWQLLSDIFMGDRPPPVVDPNSFIAQHGVDNNFNGQTAGQVVTDIGKAVPEGILTAAMMLGGEGEAEGAYQAADKALKAAKNCPRIDPNKLRHIFDNARHDLGGLLSQFKSQEEAFAAIQGATEAAAQQQKLTGIFETTVQVGGQAITVRGNVVNGVVQIGTAFK
jgi:RHS repeat-associated protein